MTYVTQPTTMWFDRRLVMRPSRIHGIGTFATDDIHEGELLVLVTGGLVYTPEAAQRGSSELAGELYNEDVLPNGQRILTPKVFHYYINHSDEPNAVDVTRHPSSTQYVAARPILAGEEITASYLDSEESGRP
ncbi:SET domain-containing protein-lysine N-methyltransferase [Deinococcus yavapaiensis]|uniref:SET domain-containing protein n=1 Tax=Deinococcus yavapaiensis KR-236 TaxID=694435 RepID=A0A318S8K7_9DEIO|nr:SET domain-containing protein [Deinococcus yavapaiensis]PYE54865.1 SET domain-containing protein [Deinococcus yavapaiensis KR-236]